MKNFLLLVVTVLLLFACGPKPVTKVTGVVKKFNPVGRSSIIMTSGPEVIFEDGRSFILKDMPEVPILEGSEIIIYYTGKNEAHLFNDSVVIVKEAPPKAIIPREFVGLIRLASGEFEVLANLIVTKGVKVTSSDNQYVYKDKFGNRHALITIRRTNNRADPQAPVSQISVWVNGRDSPKDKVFFSYIIKVDAITYAADADPQAIKETINHLLVIAEKQ